MELAPGIVSIGQKKGGRVHAFLVADGHELTLVDTLYDTDASIVLTEIRRLGRSFTDLKRIVLTHAHRSHLGGLAVLKRLSGATVLSHEWEADIVEGTRPAQPVSIVPRRPLRAYVPFQLGSALGLGKHPPCPVDETVKNDDAVGSLRVVHTPGHTPGHLAFHSAERGVLLSGDAIVTWPEFAAGWPSFTLNPVQHRASLRRMAELQADTLGVGHGEPILRGAADRVDSLL